MLWICGECTTAYSVGAPRCPHCGSTDQREESDMAKITKHGGPSDKLANPPDQNTPGGEQPSAGSSSNPSSLKPEQSDTGSSDSGQSPAPTTESPSDKDQTASGSAPTTGGKRTFLRRN